MRKDNNRKGEQPERFSIDEELQSLDKEELFDLLKDILEQKPEIFELILEWFKEKQKTSPEKGTKKTFINDELLMEYWSDAREIISEFNEYGGGFEDAMMDVFFEICQTKEEWEYLVKKLGEHPSDWRKKLIMDIQKEHNFLILNTTPEIAFLAGTIKAKYQTREKGLS